MNAQHNDAVIAKLLARLGRKNSRLEAHLDAWIGTMDRLGYAIARAGPESTFRLNQHARDDLGITHERPVKLPELGNRMVIVRNKILCIWKPQAGKSEASLDDLSRRELQVWEWLKAGKTAEETAIILGISRRTVEKHRQNIYRKLRLCS